MKMLLEDIKNGDINLILAKDLSRVSRNQSEFADLLDCFLPQYNCGLIAVNDGVNTRRNSSDMMSFKTYLMNFIAEI